MIFLNLQSMSARLKGGDGKITGDVIGDFEWLPKKDSLHTIDVDVYASAELMTEVLRLSEADDLEGFLAIDDQEAGMLQNIKIDSARIHYPLDSDDAIDIENYVIRLVLSYSHITAIE